MIARLRAATAAQHQQLEQQALFARLLRANLCLADYRAVLRCLYRVHAALEPALCAHLAAINPPWRYVPRLPLLQQDLQSLADALPDTPPRVPLTAAEVPGVLYVLEGSLLGGQLIARHLRQQFGPEIPQSFYRLGAQLPPQHWRHFAIWLAQQLPTAAAQLCAEQAAQQTFTRFLAAADADSRTS